MTQPEQQFDPKVSLLLQHLVAQATEHAFILIDCDGRIMWCNSGAERLFSVALSNIVGRDFREIFTDRDQAAGIDGLEIAIAKSDAIAEDDRWHVRADGSVFWSAGALVPIRDPATDQLLAFGKIIRDRTDLKAQVDLLTNQNEALQSRERFKDRAITQLSHELRNVFSGLRGAIELLNSPLDSEPLRVRFADLMNRQLATLERLTEDVLDAKRAAAGKLLLETSERVLQSELRATIESFQHKLKQRRVSLELLAPPAEIRVSADPVRLQQIFSNLIDNSIKYTPSDGRIWVKATTEDNFAVVHIEDTGRGIPPEMLQKIFELFTQVDASASSGGLGVGLALVRELVLLHGGSVQAISKGVDQGSEFTVRLPLLEVATHNASQGT